MNEIRVSIYHLAALPPAQSQMNLFLDTLCARNKQRDANFNQSREDMSRVTATAMFFSGTKQLIFAGTGILKIDSFGTLLGSPPMP